MGKEQTLLNAAKIDRILDQMTGDMINSHKHTNNLAFVGIHTRGVHLAKRIQDKLHNLTGMQVPFGLIDITMYRDDWTRISHHPVVQTTDIPFEVEGCQVVLVDDVLYTGRTMRAAMDALMDFGRPDRIEVAVLVDRGHRELPIKADYVGHFLKTQRHETVNVMLTESDGVDKVVLESEQ